MNGDRQKCIDAGMDDYLSKPFRMQHLLAAIDKLGLSDENSGPKNNEDTDGRQLKVGVEALFNKLGGNKRVVATCLNLFHEEVPPQLNKIDAAVQGGNPEELRTICHGLRGALSTMEMYESAKIVKQIEDLAKFNRFVEIKKLVPVLKNEIKEAADYIGSVV
jgi:HPt (histidine-containing phosphotransfer) domain-containing protein